jgi:membrane protein YdbS with pleckstrin-like domain
MMTTVPPYPRWAILAWFLLGALVVRDTYYGMSDGWTLSGFIALMVFGAVVYHRNPLTIVPLLFAVLLLLHWSYTRS